MSLLLLAVATNACATASVAQVSPETTIVVVASAPDSVKPVPVTSVIDEVPRFVLTPRNVRLIVSVNARRLWVVAGTDTLRSATVSVASGSDLTYGGRRWRFATPRGRLFIRGKRTDPVWLPPDWHYAEVAQRNTLKLARLVPETRLRDGSRLVLRDSVVGLIKPGDTTFLALPTTEHIVFDSTLFIPPIASLNRRLHGELGDYALDLGDGYMLHGTNDQRAIGSNTTHGCIRLADRDLAWLYTYVPVGVTVVVK
ncbi:MAG: L,D-transpeptidase [Gemmatimonas sp.]|jgi:lipoprotein-anchoring transpeptidase ErfK/SrfK|uniref:L,D-transpeptidase n=1 Tax=Gemmatimonas sp. TaxID=1962908 RepID=UPI0031C1AE98|nr:L,D-transpeptidase [Gemmatimonas sp.]